MAARNQTRILSYSTVRQQSIHITRTNDWFSAAEITKYAGKRIWRMILAALGVAALVVRQLLRPRAEFNWSFLSILGIGCLAVVVVYFLLGLLRRRGEYSEYFEVTRDRVTIRGSIDVGDLVFSTDELAGVTNELGGLSLIRSDGTSARLFSGHEAETLENVELSCRTFLASIRPSAMANAITPPRPKL